MLLLSISVLVSSPMFDDQSWSILDARTAEKSNPRHDK